jgi:hypothetical protein
MNVRTYGIVGVVALAVIAGIIFSLQNFDAEKVSCDAIADARTQLQSQYDTGVAASVQVFAEERTAAEQTLSRCLTAEPADPCADAQKARDAAVENYNNIPSPKDDAPYAEFKQYFAKRDDAYNAYKSAKSALEQCRAANPKQTDIPYEKSSTKTCFDAYDASMKTTQDTFDSNTQAMRAALKAALAALDAREKACHPPSGKYQFTALPKVGETGQGGSVSENILGCKLINPNLDTELYTLQQQKAALEAEIQSNQTTIDNAQKRAGGLERDLREADTYIPPESAKTQFEGTLNALRGQRKESIQSALDFYKSLISRKQEEQASRKQELADVQAKIAARQNQIQKDNEERQRKYPTAVHQAKPDTCAYYHCHGMLCGIPDPDPHGCGQGSTSPSDTDCKAFIDAYLKAAGAQ